MNLGSAIESLNEERIYQTKYEDETADKSMAQAIRILKAAQESGLTEERIVLLLKSGILNELWKLSADLGHGELMAVIKKLERG